MVVTFSAENPRVVNAYTYIPTDEERSPGFQLCFTTGMYNHCFVIYFCNTLNDIHNSILDRPDTIYFSRFLFQL